MSSEPLPRSEAIMEVLPLYLDGGKVMLAMLGDLSLQVGWHALKHPNEVACSLAEEFGLHPLVAHSTSWRHEPARLIVTYAAVVEPMDPLPPMVRAASVGREDLARGSALRAPAVIGIGAVVEHALRHLAWLAADDDHVRGALPRPWLGALAVYPPEPFRSFESGWTR